MTRVAILLLSAIAAVAAQTAPDCSGKRGYDRSNPSASLVYSDASLANFDSCKSQCSGQDQQSFAYNTNQCLCYSTSLAGTDGTGNVAVDPNSPNIFYDVACTAPAPSTTTTVISSTTTTTTTTTTTSAAPTGPANCAGPHGLPQKKHLGASVLTYFSYDRGNPSASLTYQDSSLANFQACQSKCSPAKSLSFAYGNGYCLCYSTQLSGTDGNGNVNVDPSSPYIFYDIDCPAPSSTSTQTTATTTSTSISSSTTTSASSSSTTTLSTTTTTVSTTISLPPTSTATPTTTSMSTSRPSTSTSSATTTRSISTTLTTTTRSTTTTLPPTPTPTCFRARGTNSRSSTINGRYLAAKAIDYVDFRTFASASIWTLDSQQQLRVVLTDGSTSTAARDPIGRTSYGPVRTNNRSLAGNKMTCSIAPLTNLLTCQTVAGDRTYSYGTYFYVGQNAPSSVYPLDIVAERVACPANLRA